MANHAKLIIALPAEAVAPVQFEAEPDTVDCEVYTEDAITQFGRVSQPYDQLIAFFSDPIWKEKAPELSERFLRRGWDTAMQAAAAVLTSYSACKLAREYWLRVAAACTLEAAECARRGLSDSKAKEARDAANRRASELLCAIRKDRLRFDQCQQILFLRVFTGYAQYYGLDVEQLSDVPLGKRKPAHLSDPEEVELAKATALLPN